MHDLWERCNAIGLGLIMNSASKDLVSTVIYGSDAYSVWEDLRERFDKINASRYFYQHKEIVTLCQGTMSISSYFSRLRELWDFLMGLNESYAHTKSQVLMTVPVPNVNQAYAMILNVESQRLNGGGMGSSSNDTSSETALMSNRMQSYAGSNNGHSTGLGSS
ncbi:uncharacterized protein LOC107024413 [Solanum pennellii]|uniref:Uncharacterized protein LOC107024413 n=1 Tax=Solanum pennellii TaxID=28526 RepID=A0ABM1H653_SOLPN|nr:uncharacterized protein LOC107024413 [Solanum pennellii]